MVTVGVDGEGDTLARAAGLTGATDDAESAGPVEDAGPPHAATTNATTTINNRWWDFIVADSCCGSTTFLTRTCAAPDTAQPRAPSSTGPRQSVRWQQPNDQNATHEEGRQS